jgi:photosystem II stability/assembly factor-like uncharacterized protein
MAPASVIAPARKLVVARRPTANPAGAKPRLPRHHSKRVGLLVVVGVALVGALVGVLVAASGGTSKLGASRPVHHLPPAVPTLGGAPAPTPVSGPVSGPTAGPTVAQLSAVSCPTTLDCVAVGSSSQGGGVVASSRDGGRTWSAQTTPGGVSVLDAVMCIDASHCVAGGAGVALTTTDGGSTWRSGSLPSAQISLLGVTCASARDCLAAADLPQSGGPETGVVLRSEDGGTSWSTAAVPRGLPGLGAVACLGPSTCVAVGDAVLVSTDGGAQWSQRPVVGGVQSLRSVSCASADLCVAVGPSPGALFQPTASGNAVITTDGGQHWTRLALPPGTGGIWKVTCVARSACLAAGAGTSSTSTSVMVRSSDGVHWSAVSAPATLTQVADLSCPSVTSCVAVGAGGGRPAAASTTDGTSWATTGFGS